jgi:hypothetical protein
VNAVQVTSRYSGRDSAEVIAERRLRIPLEAAKYVGAVDSRTLALVDCDAEVDVSRRLREVMDPLRRLVSSPPPDSVSSGWATVA